MQHHSFIRNLPPLFINLSYKQAQSVKLLLSKWIFLYRSAGEQVEMSSERSSSHPFVGLAFKLEVGC